MRDDCGGWRRKWRLREVVMVDEGEERKRRDYEVHRKGARELKVISIWIFDGLPEM